jgi:hypothetical protein
MDGSDVEGWFIETRPAAESTMRRVREVIMTSDARMTEFVQYGTVHFAYQGDLAAFVQTKKRTVTPMFNRGARIPGSFPHLEGAGPTARFMSFADVSDVEARAAELHDIVAAWCSFAQVRAGSA